MTARTLRPARGQAMAEYSALLWFCVGAVFFVGPPVLDTETNRYDAEVISQLISQFTPAGPIHLVLLQLIRRPFPG